MPTCFRNTPRYKIKSKELRVSDNIEQNALHFEQLSYRTKNCIKQWLLSNYSFTQLAIANRLRVCCAHKVTTVRRSPK